MQPVEPWVAVAVIAGLIVVGALVLIAWVWRSPDRIDNPWVATLVGIAALLLAAALWPFYPILLVLALPAALIVLVAYLIRGRRAAG